MKMKKLLAMLLAGAMMVSTAACGSEKDRKSEETVPAKTTSQTATDSGSSAESETADEGIAPDAFAGTEITVAIVHNPNDKGTPEDKVILNILEEETGIKANIIEIDSGAQAEMVGVMLAGDMPDIMIGLVGESDIASNMELFYDLSEEGLLETYAPDILEDIESTSAGLESLVWEDGSIRTLMTNAEFKPTGQTNAIFFMNKAWLDQLGLDMPNSAETFYEVLCAFRDNDMNGDGDAGNEIPMSFCDKLYCGQLYNFMNFWGLASSGGSRAEYAFDGETVSPTLDTQQYRNFLEYTNKLADDGLLDLEGFSQTVEQISSGLVGCFYGWAASLYTGEAYAEDYVVCTPFGMMEGVDYVQSGYQNKFNGNRTGVAFSADANIEACLHWWNYMASTPELKFTSFRGEQGMAWDYDENGNAVTISPDVSKLPEGWTATNYCYTYGFLMGDRQSVLTLDEVTVDMKVARTQYVYELFDYLQPIEYQLPSKFISAEAVDERSFIEVELGPVINTFEATSITEGVTDESWEKYLDDLEAVGYYDWINWYQRYVDGEF